MTEPMPIEPTRQPYVPWSWWKIVGVILTCLLAIAGLAILALVVLIFVYLGSSSSNK